MLGDECEIIESGPMIICAIVMINSLAKQGEEKKTIAPSS
jgi:hypothetical protein